MFLFFSFKHSISPTFIAKKSQVRIQVDQQKVDKHYLTQKICGTNCRLIVSSNLMTVCWHDVGVKVTMCYVTLFYRGINIQIAIYLCFEDSKLSFLILIKAFSGKRSKLYSFKRCSRPLCMRKGRSGNSIMVSFVTCSFYVYLINVEVKRSTEAYVELI